MRALFAISGFVLLKCRKKQEHEQKDQTLPYNARGNRLPQTAAAWSRCYRHSPLRPPLPRPLPREPLSFIHLLLTLTRQLYVEAISVTLLPRLASCICICKGFWMVAGPFQRLLPLLLLLLLPPLHVCRKRYQQRWCTLACRLIYR